MAAETQYTARTEVKQLTTANSYLDGTEALSVITAAAYGTLIKTVTIKAVGSTQDGIVRLFVYDGSVTKILKEVTIPTVTQSGTDKSFEITLPLDFMLVYGGILKATTSQSNTFNVIAEGLDWTYYTTSVRPESANYTANTGMATINTANSNLDGTGSITQVIVATATLKGTLIQSIITKAQVNTTPGMIRIFLEDSKGNKYLFKEVKVPYITKSATAHSFSYRIDFGGRDFALESEWSIYATTENSEAFNIIAEGLNWTYPA